MSRMGSRLLTASLTLAGLAVFAGTCFANGPAKGQGGVRQAAGGFGAGGGVGGGAGGGGVGAIGGGVGIVGGGGGGAIGRGGVGGGFGAVGFGAVGGGAAFPFAGGMPMQGGVGLLGVPMGNPAVGGMRMGGGIVGGGFGAVGMGGVRVGGFGAVGVGGMVGGGGFGGGMGAPGVGGMVGAAGAARTPPATRLTTPVAPPKQEMVDRDVVFDVASDATYSRLQSSPTGLNYIDAKFDDIKVGQRLSLSAGKKGGPARPDDVTGTVVALNLGNRQVTLKVSVPAEQPAGELSYIAQNVMIRSQATSK